MRNPNPANKTRIRETISHDWGNKSVLIVTQSTCTHCKDLLTILNGIGIQYTTLDISTEQGKMYAKESGSKTTPVVVLMTSDTVNKYLSLDSISTKCMITEIEKHLGRV